MGFAVGVDVVVGMGFGVAVAGGFFTCKSRILITALANHFQVTQLQNTRVQIEIVDSKHTPTLTDHKNHMSKLTFKSSPGFQGFLLYGYKSPRHGGYKL